MQLVQSMFAGGLGKISICNVKSVLCEVWLSVSFSLLFWCLLSTTVCQSSHTPHFQKQTKNIWSQIGAIPFQTEKRGRFGLTCIEVNRMFFSHNLIGVHLYDANRALSTGLHRLNGCFYFYSYTGGNSSRLICLKQSVTTITNNLQPITTIAPPLPLRREEDKLPCQMESKRYEGTWSCLNKVTQSFHYLLS